MNCSACYTNGSFLHFSSNDRFLNNGNKIENEIPDSATSSNRKHSVQPKLHSSLGLIMQSKVAFVLAGIAVMWLGIAMGKFLM